MFNGFRKGTAYPGSGESTGVKFGAGLLGTANTTNFIHHKIHRYATLIREGAFYLSLKSGRYLITQKPHWCRCKQERKQCKCERSSHVVKLTRISSNTYIPEISARDFQELLEQEESNGAHVKLYLQTDQEIDPIQLSENRLLIEREDNPSEEDDFLILRLDRSKLPKSTHTSSTGARDTTSNSVPATDENNSEDAPLDQPTITLSKSSNINMDHSQVPHMNVLLNEREMGNLIDEEIDKEAIASDHAHEPSRVVDSADCSKCTVEISKSKEESQCAAMVDGCHKDDSDYTNGEASLVETSLPRVNEMLRQLHVDTSSPSEQDLDPLLCQSPIGSVIEAKGKNSIEVSELLEMSLSDESDSTELTLTEIESKNASDIYHTDDFNDGYPIELPKDQLPSIAEETKEESLDGHEDFSSTTPTRSSNSFHTDGSLKSVSLPTTPQPHRRNFSNNSQTSTKNSIISLTSDAGVRRSSHKVSKSLDIQRSPISESIGSSEKKKKGLISSLKRPVRNLTRSATGLFQHSSTSPKRRSASSDQAMATTSESSILSDQGSLSPTREKKGILSSTKKFFRKRTVSMNV
ncbi:hypothetical protein K493DRAFT_332403 [Basidiobolus meristosporus CBS 931.73]|uniref:Uncharacterized protein n=1 Tax=Basidiobolus meristosporus CBS 931.73 TaxID=1314790 RepID=A0A1Y1ZDF4_9FUNG|nr:hypothetical protein K493DRAFT_332403 [Basidiobolus meristosporus CBS 931.73]|eukprot:ORY08268.1 hypothetical protein K493DRAFT_332403 [Basidiobolus meristosporus CBS 931.73]